MSLLSSQWAQTLQQLRNTDIIMRDTVCILRIATPLKHTRPGVHQAHLLDCQNITIVDCAWFIPYVVTNNGYKGF